MSYPRARFERAINPRPSPTRPLSRAAPRRTTSSTCNTTPPRTRNAPSPHRPARNPHTRPSPTIAGRLARLRTTPASSGYDHHDSQRPDTERLITCNHAFPPKFAHVLITSRCSSGGALHHATTRLDPGSQEGHGPSHTHARTNGAAPHASRSAPLARKRRALPPHHQHTTGGE